MTAGYVCPECGLDYDTVKPPDAVVAIRSFPRRFREALAVAGEEADGARDALLRQRPEPSTWSALEYTAHVADLLATFTEVVRRMNDEDHPAIDFWDPDERAASRGYNGLDPEDVLVDLDGAAGSLATEVGRVDGRSWGRTAAFPWGDRDLLMMVRNAVHEGSHHLRDVQRVLAAVDAAGQA